MSRRTRDQERAAHAYACVARVDAAQRKDYKILVNDFGANVMRSGLCAALAFVQRKQGKDDDGREKRDDRTAASVFAGHVKEYLVRARLLDAGKGEGDLMTSVQRLEVARYMVVTREVLALSLWFRRAVQAIIPNDAQGGR